MVCVIADDITGAAEMAGIAHRLGLTVSLSLDRLASDDCDVAVLATDTRSMTEAEAVSETRRVAAGLRDDHRIEFLFKKTDSALRGHVVAELSTLLEYTDYRGALYIPANPSKGRTITDGVYYISGVPISETDFSFDPEFPAYSSLLTERFRDADEKKVYFSDADNAADIICGVKEASEKNLLLAGAADLFDAFLKSLFTVAGSADRDDSLDVKGGSCIIVCGSTQSDPSQCGVAPAFMPTELYDGEVTSESWEKTLEGEYLREPHRILMAVKDRHRTGREVAVHLRSTMSRVVSRLVAAHKPGNLIIEGGATAFSILRSLGWNKFKIRKEISPGVISMETSDGTFVTMKPGSYPWGGLFC